MPAKEIWIPLANFTAAAIIVAVMEENSVAESSCAANDGYAGWVLSATAFTYFISLFALFPLLPDASTSKRTCGIHLRCSRQLLWRLHDSHPFALELSLD